MNYSAIETVGGAFNNVSMDDFAKNASVDSDSAPFLLLYSNHAKDNTCAGMTTAGI